MRVIENKQFHEIADSAPSMISMTCDTVAKHLVSFGETKPFVFAVFGWSTPKRNAGDSSDRRRGSQFGARRVVRKRQGLCRWSVPFGKHTVCFRGRFAALGTTFRVRLKARKKLRERALKPLKQLARVNLCARPCTLVRAQIEQPRRGLSIGSTRATIALDQRILYGRRIDRGRSP